MTRRDIQPLLSAKEAAMILGIKPRTLYGWVAEKQIAHVKVGRLTMFERADLVDFINRNRHRADPLLSYHPRVNGSVHRGQ